MNCFTNLKVLLGLRDDERIMVLYDSLTHDFISEFVRGITNYELVNLDLFKRPITNLPEIIINKIPFFDVFLLCADKISDGSATELCFRRELTNLVEVKGKRIGVLLSAGYDELCLALSADPYLCEDLTIKLSLTLKKISSVRIVSDIGTNLTVNFSKDTPWCLSTGRIKPFVSRNAVCSEVFTYPESVNGIFVCASSYGYLNYVKELGSPQHVKGLLKKNPVICTVRNSRIINIKCSDKIISDIINAQVFGYKNSDRIGEVGFGTNVLLKEPIGILMLDEKLPGVHIAHGHGYPKLTGADYDCSIHYDFVIDNPTVTYDNNKLFYNNKYCLDSKY